MALTYVRLFKTCVSVSGKAESVMMKSIQIFEAKEAIAAVQLMYFFGEETIQLLYWFGVSITFIKVIVQLYPSPSSWFNDPLSWGHDFDGIRPTVLGGLCCSSAYVSKDF